MRLSEALGFLSRDLGLVDEAFAGFCRIVEVLRCDAEMLLSISGSFPVAAASGFDACLLGREVILSPIFFDVFLLCRVQSINSISSRFFARLAAFLPFPTLC